MYWGMMYFFMICTAATLPLCIILMVCGCRRRQRRRQADKARDLPGHDAEAEAPRPEHTTDPGLAHVPVGDFALPQN